jgi:hypothetical protein
MSGWISVSERLPDRCQVIVASGFLYDNSSLGRWVEPCVYEYDGFHPCMMNDDGETVADFDADMTPTHWQPLPEPPCT